MKGKDLDSGARFVGLLFIYLFVAAIIVSTTCYLASAAAINLK